MRHFIATLIDKEDLVGAEIGVYKGGHAHEMLNYLKIKKLHLVDHYLKYYAPEAQQEVTQERQDVAKEEAQKLLAPHEKNIVWHIKSSLDASAEVDDESLDFVYIDASHSYNDLTNDLYAWFPKVKKGGFVAGHDWGLREIRDAVNHFASKHSYPVEELQEDWYFKKS
jgi:hypothetical protein